MSKYILSIDDDEDILYTIQEICQSQGWISLLARSFDEAKEILCQQGGQSPDLILIDYHLPRIDGIQAVRNIRSLGIQAPIIVLTIEEKSQVMERFLAAGADDYAIKPVKLVDLLSRINTHLKYSQKELAVEYLPVKSENGTEKGINQSTLSIITSSLQSGEYMDTSQLQKQTQLNAKTIHRYLLYLVREHRVETQNTYGKRGRPRVFYRWIDE